MLGRLSNGTKIEMIDRQRFLITITANYVVNVLGIFAHSADRLLNVFSVLCWCHIGIFFKCSTKKTRRTEM